MPHFLWALTLIGALLCSSAAVGQTEAELDDLNKEAVSIRRAEPRKAIEKAKAVLEQALAIDYAHGIQVACNTLGLSHEQIAEYKQSVSYFRLGLQHLEDNTPPHNIANLNNGLGVSYWQLAMYDSSMYCHMKALRIWEEEGDDYFIAGVSNNIGDIYLVQGDVKSGMEMYERALELSQAIGDDDGIKRAHSNLSDAQRQIGNSEEAMKHQLERLALAESGGDEESLAKSYNDLGTIYMNTGEYDKALGYLKQALQLEKKRKDKLGIAENLRIIGQVLGKKRDYLSSTKFLEKAIELAQELDNPHLELTLHRDVAQVLTVMGIHDAASEHLTAALALKDEVFNAEREALIQELRTQYETEKAERENQILKQNNQIQQQQIEMQQQDNLLQELQLERTTFWLIGIVIAAILLGLIALFFVRSRRLKDEQRTVRLEQQLLRSQMNPHFIFNSLSSIQSFMFSNNPADAGRYLSKFAKLMRLILENSRQELIPLEKEIQTLENYLELQRLRFEEKFDYRLEIDENLDREVLAVPPMLAQPFIENAVEHGLKHKESRGTLVVKLGLNSNQIEFEVVDDGIGREQAQAINRQQREDHQSYAIKITEERFKSLNRERRKNPFNFSIRDLGSAGGQTGTQVTFALPVQTALA